MLQFCSSAFRQRIEFKVWYTAMHGTIQRCAEMKWDKADGKGQHYTVYCNMSAVKVINIHHSKACKLVHRLKDEKHLLTDSTS